MDSMERLSQSLEQAVALIHSLRRENRDLARQAAEALAGAKREVSATAEEIQAKQAEAAELTGRLQQALEEKSALEARISQADLETARQVELLQLLQAAKEQEKAAFEERLRSLEADLTNALKDAAEFGQAEMDAAKSRIAELEALLNEKTAEFEAALSQKTAEFEAALGEKNRDLAGAREHNAVLEALLAEMDSTKGVLTELETSLSQMTAELERTRNQNAVLEALREENETELESAKVAISMLQTKVEEFSPPEEVARLQEVINGMEDDLKRLRAFEEAKAGMDAEKMEVRRQKKALAGIKKERDQVKSKLDEIYATLENLRLS